MQRIACSFKLKHGMQQEYRQRHNEIWPEMKAIMHQAGIRNYSIWNACDDLFGYFEVDDYVQCLEILSKSEIKKKWDEYMSDLITYELNPETGKVEDMELMFLFP